jgi:DNA polymerase-1
MKTKRKSFQVLDYETTGLSKRDGAEVFAYCLGSWDGGVEIYREDEENYHSRLQAFFSDTSIAKITANLKFEYRFSTQGMGLNIPNNTEWHDVILMHQILRNLHPSHAVDFLTGMYFKNYRIHYNGKTYNWKEIDKEVYQQAMDRGENWANVDKDLMRIYQHSDGQREMLLFRLLYPEILKNEKMHAEYLNEIETIKTTIRIEDYGIMVNQENTKALNKKLTAEFEALSQEVKNKYNEYYNLMSEPQVSYLLFSVLKYPVLVTTKTGKPSAKKDVLIMMKETYPDDKVFDYIMKWRALVNGITLTAKYLRLSGQYNGLIHTTINSNKARTSRQSSENPPLQNITKEINPNNPYPIPLRSCFCARPKRVLWFFDYKGIEMYLIVAESGCKAMKEIIINGGDPHAVARDLFYGIKNSTITIPRMFMKQVGWNKPTKILTKDELKIYRIPSKTVHFSIPYGGTDPNKIYKTLKWPLELVRINLHNYEETFPEIFHFSHTMMKRAMKTGFVTTSFGRRLFVPLDNIHSSADYLIQGGAAGILKRAEVKLDKFFRDELNDKIKMTMPIHDEIIMCAPDYNEKEKKAIMKKVSEIMTDMPEISIPLQVEIKESNTTWNDAKEVHIE